MLDREHPLATLEDAMEDIVVAIADLQDLTREQRYKVETVKRDTPKVGRNDPCPCGSGKKFKQCHGGVKRAGRCAPRSSCCLTCTSRPRCTSRAGPRRRVAGARRRYRQQLGRAGEVSRLAGAGGDDRRQPRVRRTRAHTGLAGIAPALFAAWASPCSNARRLVTDRPRRQARPLRRHHPLVRLRPVRRETARTGDASGRLLREDHARHAPRRSARCGRGARRVTGLPRLAGGGAETAARGWDATVVITHFAPSLRSADPRYGMQPGTASFCNADDDLLRRADLGSTATCTVSTITRCRMPAG